MFGIEKYFIPGLTLVCWDCYNESQQIYIAIDKRTHVLVTKTDIKINQYIGEHQRYLMPAETIYYFLI